MKTGVVFLFLLGFSLVAFAQKKIKIVHKKDVVYVVDDIIIDYADVEKIDPKEIKSIEVLKKPSALEKYGDRARNGAIVIKLVEPQKHKKTLVIRNEKVIREPLFVQDGKIIRPDDLSAIDPDNIQEIEVLKGESAFEKYGDEGRNGVIVIRTKRKILE
jgi:outer membrane receptor for ferrienterochelin and colicin